MGTRDHRSLSLDARGTLQSPVEVDASSKPLVHACRPFARASNARATWQAVSTLTLLTATLALAVSVPTWLVPVLALPLGGLIVRVFVLEHDCGHISLFDRRVLNDRCGLLLSFLTGIALEPWRAEHNWHHNFQGQLERRGIDYVNSPMTTREAATDPAGVETRVRLISLGNILAYGVLSLLIRRRRAAGFVPFRPTWRFDLPNRERLIRNVQITNVGYVVVLALMLLVLGPIRWLLLIPLAYAIAAATGGLLFWLQHNFEHTYYAKLADWTWADVAVRGSTYLALGWPLRWFTADIGLHHVHHAHPRIPNYRLDAARRAIPSLAAVRPLSRAQVRRSFTHIFWDVERGCMVAEASIHGEG